MDKSDIDDGTDEREDEEETPRKKRGLYRCGKCGMPKRGHTCVDNDIHFSLDAVGGPTQISTRGRRGSKKQSSRVPLLLQQQVTRKGADFTISEIAPAQQSSASTQPDPGTNQGEPINLSTNTMDIAKLRQENELLRREILRLQRDLDYLQKVLISHNIPFVLPSYSVTSPPMLPHIPLNTPFSTAGLGFPLIPSDSLSEQDNNSTQSLTAKRRKLKSSEGLPTGITNATEHSESQTQAASIYHQPTYPVSFAATQFATPAESMPQAATSGVVTDSTLLYEGATYAAPIQSEPSMPIGNLTTEPVQPHPVAPTGIQGHGRCLNSMQDSSILTRRPSSAPPDYSGY